VSQTTLIAFAIVMDGLVYAAWLFIVAVGLSLIFGVMKILNVAHGAFYAFGAYGAATLVGLYFEADLPVVGGFAAMVVAAVLIGILLGAILERGLLRWVYGRDEVIVVLVTYAVFLILEDVPMDAELVEYELERARVPFESRRVDTRESFLDQLEAFRPDVILSDFTLPRFDGMSALSLARERAPAVPFLIVTGSVNEETAVGCMKAGATDYLLKSNLARIGPAIEGALAAVRARTAKARAEEALRRSEANLRAIFNNSLQAFVLIDPDGTIQALNSTAAEWSARLLGRRLKESSRIVEFVPDAETAFHAALAGETRNVERCFRDTDGSDRWFETTHAPVVDQEGTIIGVCLNARDITTRKEAERAVLESESRYSDLFDNASDLVCATDPDGAFLYVNRAWHTSIGLSDVELRSHRFIDVVHPDSRERYAEVVARVLTGETLTHVELVLVTASGAAITVEGNLSCTLGDGRPVVVRGIYRDITERKRVEEQLRQAERMQAAGRLAGGMAHEVNNMMTGVLGFSEFLLRSLAEDDPRRGEVQEIIRAGARASDVTRLVDRMAKAGFVERLPNPSDRRSVLVRATPEGHRVFAAVTPQLQRFHRDQWSNLSSDEVETLRALLAKALWGDAG